MTNNIKAQLGKILPALEASLTPEQIQIIRNTFCALHVAGQLQAELENADGIIKNCINSMTEEQRIAVAINNHIDSLSAQWAFRSHERKQMIERGQRYFGDCHGKQ